MKEKIFLTEKVKLNPTKTQEEILWKMSDLSRQLYNWALEQFNKHYEQTGKYLGGKEIQRKLTQYKKEHPEFKFLHSKAAQNVVKRLDANFKSFFTHLRNGDSTARPPKFRSGKYFFTLKYNQSGFKVTENKIILSFGNGSDIELDYDARQKFHGNENNVTAIDICKDKVTGEYYASLTYKRDKPKPKTNRAIAFDPGVKTLLTGFDGKNIVKYASEPITRRIKYFNKQLDIVQSKIDTKKKGSKNREKLVKVKYKLLRKRNSQINQTLHSYANHIVKQYGKVIIGNWNKKETVSKDSAKGKGNDKINRVVQQLPLSKLIDYLKYKGAQVEKVDEGKTTRTCCKCGYLRRKHVPPTVRTLECPKCGIVVDRDANAAVNIYNRHFAHVTGPLILSDRIRCRSWSYSFQNHGIIKLQEKLLNFSLGSPRLQSRGEVTDYQTKEPDLERLVKKLENPHIALKDILSSIGTIGDALYFKLDIAYQQIASGKEEFVVKSNASYHQRLCEIHHLLVEMVKNVGISTYGNTFVGWKSTRELPIDLKKLSKFIPNSSTFIKTDTGWVAYISPGFGVIPAHFLTVKRVNDEIFLSVSDFMDTRAAAVKEILTSNGFKITSDKIICMPDLEEGALCKRNYITDLKGSAETISVVIQVIARSQHMFWLRINAQTQEEAKKREKFIIKYLLEKYIAHPELPLIPWLGEAIGFSTLTDIFASCSEEDIKTTLDRLIVMTPRKLDKVLRKEYRFQDIELFP